jgi:hypothetical protein
MDMLSLFINWCHIAGVVIYGGPVAHDTLKVPKVDSFHHEYSSMACTLEFVDDVQSAIDHINRYGRYGACSFKHTFPTYCFYWTKFVCLKYFCFSAHTDGLNLSVLNIFVSVHTQTVLSPPIRSQQIRFYNKLIGIYLTLCCRLWSC